MYRRHSATVSMQMLPGRVLSLKMAGPLTAAALSSFAADAVRMYGAEAIGFVLDYRRGVIVAGAEDLGAMLMDVSDDSPLRRPGAFVGQAGALDTLREHAFRMARQDFPRRVFTTPERAHAWVLKAVALGY